MPSQLIETTSLRQRLTELRQQLAISWRHMPIRLGIRRADLDQIRFADHVDRSLAESVLGRIGILPIAS